MNLTDERNQKETKKKPKLKLEEAIEYVNRAREGDERAFEVLLDYVKTEFKSVQKNRFIFGNETSDNDQEFSLMLLVAIEKFEPERCKSFSYYIRKLCHGRLVSMIQETKRHKNYTLNAAQSLDMIVCHDSEGNECRLYDLIASGEELLSDKLERQQYAQFLKNKLFESLTELEKDVVELHFQSYSYAEIASMLKLKDETGVYDTKSVDNALQRAKNKIPKIMKDEIEEYEKSGGYKFERSKPRTRKKQSVLGTEDILEPVEVEDPHIPTRKVSFLKKV